MPIVPFAELNQAILESGGQMLNECMQCGQCSGLCPWGAVDAEFNTRVLLHMGQIGVEGFESDEILFACTTCRLCVDHCPREVAIVDVIQAMRRMMVDSGAVPHTLRAVLGSLHSNGNPWSLPRENRTGWVGQEEVPAYDGTQDHLLYLCCTHAFDPRGQKVARALARLFKAAGLSFGIIGIEESCCGQAARKVGAEELFRKLAQSNIELFASRGVKKIITSSPHCFVTLTQEYPELGGRFEVVHYVKVLRDLVAEGRVAPKKPVAAKVAYHDPCYQGRYALMYDEPREVIRSVPEAELVEFADHRDMGLCCGGGGGGIWMEVPPEHRFSNRRAREAGELEAEALVTSCPYCVSMLEDAVKVEGLEGRLEVLDLAEYLERSLE